MDLRSTFRAAVLCALIGLMAMLAATLAPVPTTRADAQGLSVEQINAELGIGVNLGNALEGPREGDWGLTLQADFFSTIADAGFGHVRVPIRFSGYASQSPPYAIPDGIDPTVPNADNLWDRIDWVIANAEASGLYVIIDLHHYDELFADVAGERARFLAIWDQIAQRYASASPRVLFEVLNEPHGQFNDDAALLNTLLADVIGVVRTTNPTRPILVGPTHWNSISSLDSLSLPNDPNLIVSVHFYEPFPFTHQGATWVDPVPPAPTSFDAELVDYGSGWSNWSWETTTVSTSSSLGATFDRQWAGLGFARPSLVNPASLSVEVSGASELSVRCVSPTGTDVEVSRITTTSTATTFNLDMASCPNQTQTINFMMASPTFDSLSFFEIELCEADGTCSRLIESGAQAISSSFADAAAWGQANGRPINVGEFGAYSAGGVADLGERAEWTELVRIAGRSHGFSMTYWEFGAGFGVYDPNLESWVTPLLDALGVEGDTAYCAGQLVTINLNTNGGFVTGTTGDDVVLGTPGADVIDTGTGADTVCAGGGNDVVFGGADNDMLFGGDGNDVLRGQAGDDMIEGHGGADNIKGGGGADELWGLGGNDVLDGGGGIDTIFGGDGADVIDGRGARDFLYGGAGADEISGQNGADEMWGGGAGDTLVGQTGPDVLHGDGGDDTMLGGDGNDMFYGGAGFDKCSGNTGNGDQAESSTCEQTPGIENLF